MCPSAVLSSAAAARHPIDHPARQARIREFVSVQAGEHPAPLSIDNLAISTMGTEPTKAYAQNDATSFIRLNALRLKVAARVQRKK